MRAKKDGKLPFFKCQGLLYSIVSRRANLEVNKKQNTYKLIFCIALVSLKVTLSAFLCIK